MSCQQGSLQLGCCWIGNVAWLKLACNSYKVYGKASLMARGWTKVVLVLGSLILV